MVFGFKEWYDRYASWDTIGWLSIIFVGAGWEIYGAVGRGTTFTDLVRNTVPIWVRAVVLGVLIWHFIIAKANY